MRGRPVHLRSSSIKHEERQELERLAAAWGARLAVEDLAVEDLAVLHEIAAHRQTLVGFARFLCGNLDDAEDIVGDAFLVAARKYPSPRPERPLTWLRAVVRWVWIGRIQRRRMERRHFALVVAAIRGEGWRCAR